MRTEYDRQAGCYRATLRWQGDPYTLISVLERHFGSLFFYRVPGALGRQRYVLASLEDARVLYARDFAEGGEAARARLRACLDQYTARAGSDVVFALAYDLAGFLRVAKRNLASSSGEPLAYVAQPRRRVTYDERHQALSMQAPTRAELAVLEALSASKAGQAGNGEARAREPGGLTTLLEDIDAQRLLRQLQAAHKRFDDGDIYQVVLSAWLRVAPHMSADEYFRSSAGFYRAATFSYYLSHERTKFFGNCSLPHVLGEGGRVSTRVFAGTNPAAKSARERSAVHRRLLGSQKYFAEHIMLVDVERNDLSAFCVPGSVRVAKFMRPIEVGPTTYLATDVTGSIAPDCPLSKLLLTSFPRGVVTGAPKPMAQDVIAELEGEPRNFYAGVIGLYDRAARSLVSNTIVTCAHQRGSELVLQVGGGMTADSAVEEELAEMQLKVRYLV